MRLVIFLLLCPILLFSQSGPAGVGTTDGTSDLLVWLKADEGPNITTTAINGIKVNAWSDHAGYKVIGLPSELDKRPTFKFNQINEIYPSISFDGKDDFLELSVMLDDDNDEDDDDEEEDEDDEQQDVIEDPFSTKNNFILIFVARADVIHDTDPMSNIEDGNLHGLDYQKYVLAPAYKDEDNAGFGVSLGTNGIAAYEYGFNYFPAINSINNNPPYFYIGNDFHIFMVIVENKKSIIYMDGAMVGEGLTSTVEDLFIPNEIGGGMSNALANFDNFFEGDLAELMMYGVSMNKTEQIAIHNYLSAKYNIPLTENDVYQMDNPEKGNYDHDVAGLGLTLLSDSLLTSRGSGIICVSNPSDLNEEEYLFWGNTKVGFDQIAPSAPEGATTMLATTWAVSESGEVGKLDVCLDYSIFQDVQPEDLRLVIDTNGDGSFLDEVIPTNLPENLVSINTETNEITFHGQNLEDGNIFTFASKSLLNPLPISLIEFRANVVDDKSIELTWTTENELNNQYFIVERSSDSRTFSPIGMLEGNGTTSFNNQYQLLDAQPFHGDNYYRLKQVDFNGSFTYSNTVKATLGIFKEDIFIYPNPVIDELTILLPPTANGPLTIQIYDTTGKLVVPKSSRQNTLSNITLHLNLDPGIYFLRLRSKNYIHSQSFVIVDRY